MAQYNKISKDFILESGKENAVASIQKYFSDMLSYKVYYDMNISDINPDEREHPCVVIDQLDLYADSVSFMGDKEGRRERLMMLFRCISDGANGGSKPLSRRMRDQVIFILTKAGVMNKERTDFICNPIYIMDFTKGPTPKPLSKKVVIALDKAEGSMSDRFSPIPEKPHLFEYDITARFNYLTLEGE